MFSSVSDFLNSVNEASQEYKRIKKEVFLLTMRCKKLEYLGTDREIITEYDRTRRKVMRSDRPGEDLATLQARLEIERRCEVDALRKVLSRSRAVAEFIESFPYAEMRVVMRYRYLEGYTWKKMSSKLTSDGWEICLSYASVIHDRAMAFAQELWNARTDVEGGETNDAADLYVAGTCT